MADGSGPQAGGEVMYDIHLRRSPPEVLRSRYPSMSVRTSRAQTALRRQVDEPGQLDALLEKLSAMGLVLIDVHQLPVTEPERPGAPGEPSVATYEVRVAGELGDSLLHYLSWSHYAVPQQTLVRLALAPDELCSFLEACTASGVSIERVRRVGAAEALVDAGSASRPRDAS